MLFIVIYGAFGLLTLCLVDIFKAVQSGQCTYGVVPFENSTNGSVIPALDLLCDREGEFPDTRIIAETYLDVHHCLLSPCQNLDEIKQIYAHPQAFGQCEKWLSKYLKKIERVDCASTSKAAQIAKESSGEGAAAIASEVAADAYNLIKLAQNIEDAPDNKTRFFIISTVESYSSSAARIDGYGHKTLLSFTLDHKRSGALCESLEIFKQYGLNLTSIASRPSRIVPWNYIFFVEFEGHATSSIVMQALQKLDEVCNKCRVLGSYKDRQTG